MGVKIICQFPGMRRAGIVHNREKVYADDELTDDQLDILEADAAFTVIRDFEEGNVADDGADAMSAEQRAEFIHVAVIAAMADDPERNKQPTVASVEEHLDFKDVKAAEIEVAYNEIKALADGDGSQDT